MSTGWIAVMVMILMQNGQSEVLMFYTFVFKALSQPWLRAIGAFYTNTHC